MITNIYNFRKVSGSKTKYILENYLDEYKPLHNLSNKNEIVVYLSERPDFIHSKLERKPSFTLDGIKVNGKKVFHTGIYFELNERSKGFGDYGNDLILIELSSDKLTVFICKNQKHLFGLLYSQFIDGSLTRNAKFLQSDKSTQLMKKAN